MSDFWNGKHVLVTGGTGFLGSYLIPKLRAAGAQVESVSSEECDLRHETNVEWLFLNQEHIDVLFHLAATVGGIHANMLRPAMFLYDNVLMNTLIVEHARRAEVGKLVAVGSVCMYPKWTPAPFIEENLWEGYPEETNAAYGISKRTLLTHQQAIRKQYGCNDVMVIPTNLYGPGDNSDHVIPDLIERMLDAKRNNTPLTVWGTGRATRDFLYVEDCADALMKAGEWYQGSDPINLGSGVEMSIAGLVELLRKVIGFEGDIKWDGTKPDGQPRRVLNSQRAWDAFSWKATTTLEDGLRQTVAWWQNNAA